MPPILRGRSARYDLELEEGAEFARVFHNLTDAAQTPDGPHEPFEDYSYAIFTIQDEPGGTTLRECGPTGDEGFDGICDLDADGGMIPVQLVAPRTIGLMVPGRSAWYNLMVFPGGDEDRAYRMFEGTLIYSRRGTTHPPEES